MMQAIKQYDASFGNTCHQSSRSGKSPALQYKAASRTSNFGSNSVANYIESNLCGSAAGHEISTTQKDSLRSLHLDNNYGVHI